MTRKTIIAGNWKMNKNPGEAGELASELINLVGDSPKVDVVICPPYTALEKVAGIIAGSGISLGAQDVHWEDQGAYTGKISTDMLKSMGVQYVIVGHSEQRQYFHETNETVNLKTKKVLQDQMLPIVCVGETLEQREAGETNQIVENQVKLGLKDISKEDAAKLVIAYEPVWAIGTGKTATSGQAQEVHAYIRKLLSEMYDGQTAGAIRIQYGGSMKPANAVELLGQPDVDGGLIGGASLQADSFLGIITPS